MASSTPLAITWMTSPVATWEPKTRIDGTHTWAVLAESDGTHVRELAAAVVERPSGVNASTT